MIQKKLNNNKVRSSLLLYIICIISVLMMNIVNMGRGFGMDLGQFLNNNFFSQCESEDFRQKGIHIDKEIKKYIRQGIANSSILYDVFINNFKPIITDITTNYLFLTDEKTDEKLSLKRDSLLFIRKFQEFEDDVTITRPAKYSLIKKINRSIYSSRKLFLSTFAEHLTDQNLQKTNFDNRDRLQLFYNNGIILTLTRKHGAQFGGKLSFMENNKEKQYFVKTSFGYPVFNKENNIYINTIDQMKSSNYSTFKSYSQSSYDVVSATAGDNLLLNLKEPFVYKVLEQLDIGPKTDFIINPYIKHGFYIMTEDLNANGNSFTEMRRVDNMPIRVNVDVTLGQLFQGDLDFNVYSSFLSLISFNEVDIVNRIFTLNDFNTGNFGILNNRNNSNANLWLQSDVTLKIVDFSPSIKFDTGYVIDDIGTSFIEGNSITKYDMTSIMYRAVCRKHEELGNLEPGVIDNNPQIRETILRNEQEKFYFGYKALLKFEDRLQQYKSTHEGLFNNEGQVEYEQILETLLQQQELDIIALMNTRRGNLFGLNNRTNAELIGFRNNNAPANIENPEEQLIGFRNNNAPANRENPEEQLQYLDNAFNDLGTYRAGIVQNYRELRAFINNGYNIYFDGNGNLRQIGLQQQNRLQARIQQIFQQPQNQENQ